MVPASSIHTVYPAVSGIVCCAKLLGHSIFLIDRVWKLFTAVLDGGRVQMSMMLALTCLVSALRFQTCRLHFKYPISQF